MFEAAGARDGPRVTLLAGVHGCEYSSIVAVMCETVLEARDDLPPQERQIARLARDGLSNPGIGARLLLSPRAVEWHLRKVFTKLGICSRRELARALHIVGPDAVAG